MHFKYFTITFVFLLLLGFGCKDMGKSADKISFARLSALPQEIQINKDNKSIHPSSLYFKYTALEYPYMAEVMENDATWESLLIYDLEKQKQLLDFGNQYDPILLKINNKRLFFISNPPGAGLKMGKLKFYNIPEGTTVETSLNVAVGVDSNSFFDVDGNNVVIVNQKNITLYDISKPKLPNSIASLPIEGAVQKLQLVYPWIMWLERKQAVDNFTEMKIHMYNIETKTTKVALGDDRIQSKFATDGTYLAFIGQTGACTIGLKDKNAPLEDLSSNLKKDCTPGKIEKHIIITDFFDKIIRQIPIPQNEGASSLSLYNGLLAWNHSYLKELEVMLRFYDIKSGQFFEHASPNKKIWFTNPLLTKDAIIYFELDRSKYSNYGKIMMLPWSGSN